MAMIIADDELWGQANMIPLPENRCYLFKLDLSALLRDRQEDLQGWQKMLIVELSLPATLKFHPPQKKEIILRDLDPGDDLVLVWRIKSAEDMEHDPFTGWSEEVKRELPIRVRICTKE